MASTRIETGDRCDCIKRGRKAVAGMIARQPEKHGWQGGARHCAEMAAHVTAVSLFTGVGAGIEALRTAIRAPSWVVLGGRATLARYPYDDLAQKLFRYRDATSPLSERSF